MKWTVLGCQSPYPGPGGGTPGYLLETEGKSLLVDCGSGVLSKLAHHLPLHELDAVWLSHLHHDHIADFFVLQYAMLMAIRLGKRKAPLTVYAPAEPASWAGKLTYHQVVRHQPIWKGETHSFGGCTFTLHGTEHGIPCCAMEIRSGDRVLLYGADAGPGTQWESMCREPDLFVCEGSYLHKDTPELPVGHHSVLQAGQAAERIGARRLLLTHLFPEIPLEALRQEAVSAYSGELMVAEPGMVVKL